MGARGLFLVALLLQMVGPAYPASEDQQLELGLASRGRSGSRREKVRSLAGRHEKRLRGSPKRAPDPDYSKHHAGHQFYEGQHIEAEWNGDWFGATVAKANPEGGTYALDWDDGDYSEHWPMSMTRYVGKHITGGAADVLYSATDRMSEKQLHYLREAAHRMLGHADDFEAEDEIYDMTGNNTALDPGVGYLERIYTKSINDLQQHHKKEMNSFHRDAEEYLAQINNAVTHAAKSQREEMRWIHTLPKPVDQQYYVKLSRERAANERLTLATETATIGEKTGEIRNLHTKIFNKMRNRNAKFLNQRAQYLMLGLELENENKAKELRLAKARAKAELEAARLRARVKVFDDNAKKVDRKRAIEMAKKGIPLSWPEDIKFEKTDKVVYGMAMPTD